MIYTVKDISKMFDISIHTIRFYDKEGLLPFVSRNKSGNRVFTDSDLRLFSIICCLKDTGMHLKDIKKYIDLCMEGPITIDSQRKILLQHQEEVIKQIDTLNKSLSLINEKMEIYNSPNAIEIINEQRRTFSTEKHENNLHPLPSTNSLLD